jgi:hypothetical protein
MTSVAELGRAVLGDIGVVYPASPIGMCQSCSTGPQGARAIFAALSDTGHPESDSAALPPAVSRRGPSLSLSREVCRHALSGASRTPITRPTFGGSRSVGDGSRSVYMRVSGSRRDSASDCADALEAKLGATEVVLAETAELLLLACPGRGLIS